MRQLTAVGADVDAEDSSGATPLLWAMQRYGASSPTVVALKAAGADPARADKYGASALRLGAALSELRLRSKLSEAEAEPEAEAEEASGRADRAKDRSPRRRPIAGSRHTTATTVSRGGWQDMPLSSPSLASKLEPFADDGRCDFEVRDGASLDGEELYRRYLALGVPVLLTNAAGFSDVDSSGDSINDDDEEEEEDDEYDDDDDDDEYDKNYDEYDDWHDFEVRSDGTQQHAAASQLPSSGRGRALLGRGAGGGRGTTKKKGGGAIIHGDEAHRRRLANNARRSFARSRLLEAHGRETVRVEATPYLQLSTVTRSC